MDKILLVYYPSFSSVGLAPKLGDLGGEIGRNEERGELESVLTDFSYQTGNLFPGFWILDSLNPHSAPLNITPQENRYI